MKTLHLTLKKKWFDMIASGEKKEEYRELKPYWVRRLISSDRYPKETPDDYKNLPWDICYDIVDNGYRPDVVLKAYFSDLRNFERIVFKNGYAKDAPMITLECKGIEIGEANPDWSDNWIGEVFKIKLGEIIS